MSLQTSDMTKMMLFMFLGLVIAILVLGFHKSPAATPSKQVTIATNTNRTPSPTPREPYPSDRRAY